MKKGLISLFTGLLIFGFANGAQAAVLTFEELRTPETAWGNGENGHVPENVPYGNLLWHNFIWTDTVVHSQFHHPMFGAVSPVTVLRNSGGAPVNIEKTSSNFNFLGAYFASQRQHNLQLSIIGYRNNEIAYSQVLNLDTLWYDNPNPSYFELNYMNIDKIVFDSYGGNPDYRYPDLYFHDFIMDNANISPVPELSTMLLGLMSLAGAMGFRKRKANN